MLASIECASPSLPLLTITNLHGYLVTGALAKAHALYGRRDAVVLFIVQPNERNVVDQRLLELGLWEASGVRVVRITLREVSSKVAARRDSLASPAR